MGYHTYESYVVQGQMVNVNLVDSTTYYVGNCTNTSATGVANKIMIPRAGTIRRIDVSWYNVTQDCTAEDIAISVTKNAAIDSAVYTGSFANAASPVSVESANLSVAKGDYVHLKLVCPIWVTNPSGVYLNFSIEIQC